MIERKDHIDVWTGLDQCYGEGVHIGELLIRKAIDHLPNSKFYLGIWVYHLKEPLIFQRILQGEPSGSFPIANVITDPAKRLRHNSSGGDTKRHRGQTFVEYDSSSKVALIAIH
jgi:hypothetical protein